jgi:phosphoribosylanthranilate isomerase
MTRVKICGITREADRDAAIEAGADAIGIIHDVPVDTPRDVDRETATDLVAGVPPLVTSVLVTMPETVEAAVTVTEAVEPDAVQIHSGLTPAEIETLGRRLDQQVIAGVDAESDAITAYADSADAVLVDSVDSDGAGGTGETHDWEETREHVTGLETPVILAGGLTPENVGEAVRTVSPFAVDTASGVESAGGRKDHEAVAQFITAATEVSA